MPVTVTSATRGLRGASRYQSSSALVGPRPGRRHRAVAASMASACSGRSLGSFSVSAEGPASTARVRLRRLVLLAAGQHRRQHPDPAPTSHHVLLRIGPCLPRCARGVKHPNTRAARFHPRRPHWSPGAPNRRCHRVRSIMHDIQTSSPPVLSRLCLTAAAAAARRPSATRRPPATSRRTPGPRSTSRSTCSTRARPPPGAPHRRRARRHPHLGFKGVATIDEVRIYTGNGFDRRHLQGSTRG